MLGYFLPEAKDTFAVLANSDSVPPLNLPDPMVEHALLDVVLSRCDTVVYAGMVEAEEFAHGSVWNLVFVVFIT